MKRTSFFYSRAVELLLNVILLYFAAVGLYYFRVVSDLKYTTLKYYTDLMSYLPDNFYFYDNLFHFMDYTSFRSQYVPSKYRRALSDFVMFACFILAGLLVYSRILKLFSVYDMQYHIGVD